MPLTVTLPPELSAQALASALHRPLLAQLTSFDRLIDLRKDVRALLTARYDLAEEVWESPSDDDGRRVGKTRLYNVVDDVQESVRRAVRLRESQPLVGFLGRAGRIAGPVATPLECMIGRFGLEPTPSDGPSPDTMVAWLPDGGQSRDDRLAELARARDLLHPGGALIVLGHVVTAGDGSENPSISTLVEDLASVFGGMLHVDDLRSIRWPGETLSRGVLVTATSLRGGIV
ncbi:MAG: hypothetical protein ACRDO4_10140 [Nocardioides sp.]